MSPARTDIKPIEWLNGRVKFLDQTRLPNEELYIETDEDSIIADAIKRLAIRGAPLLGIAAAYGVVLGMNKLNDGSPSQRRSKFERAYHLLASTRPTAVNLLWALERIRKVFQESQQESLSGLQRNLLDEAFAIHREDAEMCQKIGEHGVKLLPNAVSVLTHCNTGRLATGGTGTALGIIVTAWEQKKLKHVYIDETRPLLQGARLTAWELGKLGIPATLIVDSAAGFVMKRGLVNAVVVGADRIAANGDTANKVGTYALAVQANHHGIPLYVAAPTSTIDAETKSGKDIPIEQRSADEVTEFFDKKDDLNGVEVYAPAFDVTPNELISAIITEQGVYEKPCTESLKVFLRREARESMTGVLS